MRKALWKKQMMEVFAWVYQNKKSGKNRSARGIAGYVLFCLLIFGPLGAFFFVAAKMLCAPLVGAGFGWIYFGVMGLLALVLGVFGGVFHTYASLYQAKDNDLLLSMPLSPGKILLVRLSGVYVIGLMYELIAMIPALIVWISDAGVGAAGVLCGLLLPLVLSVLVLALSAALGWAVAAIGGKLQHKNLVVVILSLALFGAYYYCAGNAYRALQAILADPRAFDSRARILLYPLYLMGLAAEGNVGAMLLFTGIVGLLFAIVYFMLSVSFFKIITTNRGAARARYRERRAAVRSVGRALFEKELRRFLGSANYMLNCGLGTVFLLVSAVALLWKREMIREIQSGVFAGREGFVALLAAGAVCLLSTMNDITAPAVSLEGKHLWLVRAFPVSGRQVLMAKLKLHLALTLLPAAILVAAVEWVLRPAPGYALLLPAVAALFILVMAAFGLFLNLNMPNLEWTSEIVPIKQSMGVMFALFGGWALVVALAVVYAALRNVLTPFAYLIVVALLLLAASAVLLGWLRTKGARIFESL